MSKVGRNVSEGRGEGKKREGDERGKGLKGEREEGVILGFLCHVEGMKGRKERDVLRETWRK